jgi:uncharacterized protein YnzC (UPF0291/DUF896 family)
MATKRIRVEEREQVPVAGLAVDASGGPVIDPTANVIALTTAANRRQDDLRELMDRLNELRIKSQTEMGELRAEHFKELSAIREDHQSQLRTAESQRLDAIRQVDREDVNKTAAQVLSAVQTLASQNLTTAETLRNQVATTQQASQNIFNTTVGDLNKRISNLELSSSEGRGKQLFADPQIAEMVSKMELITQTLASGGGKSQGLKELMGYIIAFVMFALGVVALLVKT